jgi:hypothetical protein
MTQHASLTPERWATFSLDQQILMIANEMHRGSKVLRRGESEPLLRCYERVLRLIDLTVEVNPRRTLRRELLRWREVVAGLYISADPPHADHVAALRVLLRFTPVASRQIPFVAA